jgi:alkylation response protein AidB-like acyl-CoA dehydrogenase
MSDVEGEIESVESFRERARAWFKENHERDTRGYVAAMPDTGDTEQELARVQHERELQRKLFDGGFAGICVPKAYGGQGLTPEHQQALCEEIAGYDCPRRGQIPTMSPCMSVILEFGTEEQKQRHVPAILKGEELWMQLLSEPSGGSDVAGALTSAVRDGDEWVLNGSKVWTTGAWWSDWGLCLARTNWDVPKHRGLTVFMLPLHQPGIDVHRIEMLNGSQEFCQEFITDVRVPDSDRIGDVNQGWTVGTRWMFYERSIFSSPYVTIPSATEDSGPAKAVIDAVALVDAAGRLDDPTARDLLGELVINHEVFGELSARIGLGMGTGTMNGHATAIPRLYHGVDMARAVQIAFELAGASAAAWVDETDGALAGRGTDFLMRQIGSIGGGTTEIARNVIAERVLGMPREPSMDRDVPFREVQRGPHAGSGR